MWAKSLQLCLTLCDAMDCSPSGSSVHGILQARILQWFAVPSSRGSSLPSNQTCISVSPALAGEFFIISATWEAQTRCDVIVCVYNGILLGYIKERNWVICSDVNRPRVCHTK